MRPNSTELGNEENSIWKFSRFRTRGCGAVETARSNKKPKLELVNKTSDIHVLPLGNSQETQDGRTHFLRSWSCRRSCMPTALDECPVVIHNSRSLWPPGPHAVAEVLYHLTIS